jgi:predicted nucleic acid-binding protein
VTLIVDTGPLVAVADEDDTQQTRIEEMLRAEAGALVVPAPITAEVDYLLGERLGPDPRRAFMNDLAAGRFLVECLGPDDYAAVVALERQYADLDPGLADLSIVIMAKRFSTRRIVTFDERHFRAIRPLQGGSFTLLPADAEAQG